MKRRSVRQRYSGRSFAQAAAQISKKYEDRDTNPLSKRSFMAEMEELVKLQELVRAKEASIDTIQEYRAPKMQWGGLLSIPGMLNNVIPGIQNYMQTATAHSNTYATNLSVTKQNRSNDPRSQPVSLLPSKISPTDFTKLPITTAPGLSSLDRPDISGIAKGLKTSAGFQLTKNPSQEFADNPMAMVASDVTTRAQQPEFTSSGVAKTEPNSIFTPMILSKTAELFGKGLMALSGYDKVSPQLNPFESEIREDLRKMRFDNTAITQRVQGEMERARGLAKGIRSEAVRQALYQNAQNQANQALSEVDVQGQAMNNQYRQARAGALNNLGQQSVQARQYAEQLNNQSKAGYQMGLQTMLESVGNIGQQVTNYKANIAQQKLLASALQTADFKFGDVGQVIAKAVNDGQLTMDDFFEINKTAKNSKEAMDLAKKKMDENLRALNKKG